MPATWAARRMTPHSRYAARKRFCRVFDGFRTGGFGIFLWQSVLVPFWFPRRNDPVPAGGGLLNTRLQRDYVLGAHHVASVSAIPTISRGSGSTPWCDWDRQTPPD